MSAIGQAPAQPWTISIARQVKPELIGGRIVQHMATGLTPSRVGFRIARSLDDHANHIGKGLAFPDNMGFAVTELASGRESFTLLTPLITIWPLCR